MAPRLRFDPAIEYKRLLARPHIDEDGVLYANESDLVGTAPRDAAAVQAEIDRRHRVQAPSPRGVPKALHEAAKEILVTLRARSPPAEERPTRIPTFQSINAPRTTHTAVGAEGVAEDEPTGRPRRVSRPRSPTPEIRELATRDWKLASIVNRKGVHEVFFYKARWERTAVDIRYIRQEAGYHLVRYRGMDWIVTSVEESILNATTGEYEAVVSWEDTWHHLWEFTSALDPVIEWERANDPQRHLPREKRKHYWWRYPTSFRNHRDPQTEFDPAWHRDIEGDEFFPEKNSDYTFALLDRLMSHLASGELGRLPCTTVVTLLNRPLRQRLIFKDSFVESGKSFKLSTPEMARAATVFMTGFARLLLCNICIWYAAQVPFHYCTCLEDNFKGCCVNSVVIGKTQESDLHSKVRIFRELAVPTMDGNVDAADENAAPMTSSPLSIRGPETRSSVEPESNGSSRTPPTSPSAVSGQSGGGGSPELGSERFSIEPQGRNQRALQNPTDSEPSDVGDLQLQNSATSTTARSTPARVLRSRKRKSSFEAGKRRSPRSSTSKEEKSMVQRPSSSAGSSFARPLDVMDEDDSDNIPVFSHEECPGMHVPCRHEIYGTPDRLPTESASIVYRNHEFEVEGEATEEQVRYVVSRLPCYYARELHMAWEECQARPGRQHATKYALLSHHTSKLNEYVRAHCPADVGFIDLTLDD